MLQASLDQSKQLFTKDFYKRFDVFLSLLTVIVCGTLFALCLYLWFFSFSSIKAVILTTYMRHSNAQAHSIGTLAGVILELELAAVVYYMPASSSHMVRGLYYVFLGTFTFAVIQWDSVIGIIIMIIGIVLTVFGLAHCFYPMLEERAVAAGFLPGTPRDSRPTYKADQGGGSELQSNQTFDPTEYMNSQVAAAPPLAKKKYDYYDESDLAAAGIDSEQGFGDDPYGGAVDYVQDRIGGAVASAARDEERQRQMGAAVSDAASSREYQQRMGSAVAASTDNEYLRMAAESETMQRYAGSAVSAAASSRTVQAYAGEAVAGAAEDKEMQKRVAGAAWSGAQSAASGASGWGQDNVYMLGGQ